jgi:hypothetical protein
VPPLSLEDGGGFLRFTASVAAKKVREALKILVLNQSNRFSRTFALSF